MKILKFFLLFFFAVTFHGHCQQTDTTQWTILLGGKQAGFLKKWKNNDNSFTEWNQWNDRGRGDSTRTTYTYNEKGFIISLHASGVDYFKKPIAEKFERSGTQVRWENASEKEERQINYDAEYLAVSVSPGTIFNQYFNSPDKKIKLLPSGESQLQVLKEHTLTDGKRIRLISVLGAGLSPGYLWIDEKNEFFAYPGDWFASIRKGYESYNSELAKMQDEFQQNYFKDLSKKLTANQAGVIIKNASVFNPKTGTVQKNQTIVIENGMIKEVSAKKNVSAPKNYKVIDATGKFVMPGLWDNHVHYGDATNGFMHIGNGVTNVRDMGSPASLLDRKKEIDDGIIIGPRIQVMCGFVDGAGPYALPIGSAITTAEEGIEAVKKFAAQGYQQIKLYSSLKPEFVKPIAAAAKKLGLRVSGHIPSYMLAVEAIADGYDEIQHTNMLFLNFYGKELDTRSTLRFSTVAQKAAFLDFNGPEFKSLMNVMKQHNTVVDPTVSFFEDMFSGKPGQLRPSATNFAHRFPVTMQRSLKGGSVLEIPPGQEDTYNKSFLSMMKMMKALYDNKITILPGTDDIAGFMLHKELENYVRAGIPTKDVLTFATLTSAQVNRKADQYGTIEPNRPADIIIIDGDPLKSIQDIEKVETVIKDKALYNTKDILNAVSIKGYK